MLVKIELNTNAKPKDRIETRAIIDDAEMAKAEAFAKEHNIELANLLLQCQLVVRNTFVGVIGMNDQLTFDNLLVAIDNELKKEKKDDGKN